MEKYTNAFIIMAVISAFIGYGDVVGEASIFAKGVFFVFVGLYVVSLLRIGVTR